MNFLSPRFALCVLVGLAVGGSSGIVQAQAPTAPVSGVIPGGGPAAEVELQRALDQPFNLVLDKVEIAEAFKRIAATAKISLNVDPACYDSLPYGETTRVSADFRNSKLRDAIEQVLVTLGLQQTVTGANVIIRPSGPLLHIGRRAQLDELKLLQDLRSNDVAAIQGEAALDWTTAIRGALDRQNIVVVMEGGGDAKGLEEVKKQLPMSVFRGLETYCQLTNQIWFAESDPLSSMTGGATVRIMPMKKWIERQLQRPIQVNFVNTPFDQVVAEMSHLTGIRFVPEPGLYQSFPALNLSSVNSSVAQTLEALAGTTRIVFDVREDSVLLHVAGSAPATQDVRGGSNGDNVVGYIAIPTTANGPSINLIFRESDLPAGVDEMRKKKLQEMLASLEKALAEPGHEKGGESGAATQPATKPEAVTK